MSSLSNVNSSFFDNVSHINYLQNQSPAQSIEDSFLYSHSSNPNSYCIMCGFMIQNTVLQCQCLVNNPPTYPATNITNTHFTSTSSFKNDDFEIPLIIGDKACNIFFIYFIVTTFPF